MSGTFDRAFEKTIGHEGGYTRGRRDRGNWTSGRVGVGQLKGTKYGVSAMTYPTLDIRNLTLEGAKSIYYADFWKRYKCDQLPAGLDYLVFDASINHGGSRAARFLQAAVGAKQDGVVGPKTLRKVRSKQPIAVMTEFCAQRQLFFTQIRTWPTYKRGWTRRTMSTLVEAILMSMQGNSALRNGI